MAQIGAAIGREFSHALLAAVVRKPEGGIGVGARPARCGWFAVPAGRAAHATYLFKHALVQDTAYGTLLREPRRALHARIAETLESQFAEIAENQPELLAHHCTEAGLIEKAAGFWGKTGQRSLERSALVEAIEQFTRALDQIATLPATPVLRREEIKLQVALITPLIHVKGYAAAETKVAADRALLLIKQAEALGEPPEDQLLLFSTMHGVLSTHTVAFNGDIIIQLAAEVLALAEKQGTTAPLLMAHRAMGIAMFYTGNIIGGRVHLEQAIALYDPAEHRPLAVRFGTDVRVHALSYRSWALWLLGYHEAALADADHALKEARGIAQAASLMNTLAITQFTHAFSGRFTTANAHVNELAALADENGSIYWKSFAKWLQGWLLALDGKASDAVRMLTSGITTWRSTGATLFAPTQLSSLASVYAQLGQFGDAWRCIGEAMTAVETTKETWCEAEVQSHCRRNRA